MAITTLADYKLFYGIVDTTNDVKITDLIPVVEEEYLDIRNIPFDEDPADTIVYPTGSGTVANMMINFQLSLIDDNGRAATSEKIGSYSISYASAASAYPKSITSKIKKYIWAV